MKKDKKITKKELLAIDLYPKMPTTEVVKKTGLTVKRIHQLVTSKKLIKEYNYFFTDLEDKFIIENYGKYKTIAIAEHLKRTPDSIRQRAFKLKKQIKK
jgi:hypothetical protein